MNEITIKVEGMHCRSCEALAVDEVKEIEGVKAVKASHTDGTVKIKCEGQLDVGKVKAAIEGLGYKVKQ